MTEMVERVAKAMFEHDYIGRSWDNNCDCYAKDEWRKRARAAIEAMREPTDAQQAAWRAILDWMADTPLGNQQRDAWAVENVRRWQIMIDAARGNEQG
jgi:hypothetical protein